MTLLFAGSLNALSAGWLIPTLVCSGVWCGHNSIHCVGQIGSGNEIVVSESSSSSAHAWHDILAQKAALQLWWGDTRDEDFVGFLFSRFDFSCVVCAVEESQGASSLEAVRTLAGMTRSAGPRKSGGVKFVLVCIDQSGELGEERRWSSDQEEETRRLCRGRRWSIVRLGNIPPLPSLPGDPMELPSISEKHNRFLHPADAGVAVQRAVGRSSADGKILKVVGCSPDSEELGPPAQTEELDGGQNAESALGRYHSRSFDDWIEELRQCVAWWDVLSHRVSISKLLGVRFP